MWQCTTRLAEAGRVVRKGQHGIKIVVPMMGTSDGTLKVVNIKPACVPGVTKTDELAERAAAKRRLAAERG